MNKDRLERVRRVREIQERALRAEWASAERSANDAEDIVNGLVQLRSSSDTELAQRVVVGSVDAEQMVRDGRALDRLDAAVAGARARAREARRVAELRRAPWQARRTEAEALRRLELRHIVLQRAEEREREQATHDEQASVRHARGTYDDTHEGGGDVERVRNDA